jgi:2-hydroxychromene-2-carboxylate isomerase
VVVRLSEVRRPRRAEAALRRALGRPGVVRLYVAFDDPHSAVAALGLGDRLAGRRVRLVVVPVVARGIAGDPAAQEKRRYAVVDARRLARRDGRELSRQDPVRADDCAFLAEWAAAIRSRRARAAFCAAALERLWLGSRGRIDRGDYVALWREHVGGWPPTDGSAALRRCERSMRRRRLYDTPVAVVHGQWFFAHERLGQIAHRLDELGWRAGA